MARDRRPRRPHRKPSERPSHAHRVTGGSAARISWISCSSPPPPWRRRWRAVGDRIPTFRVGVSNHQYAQRLVVVNAFELQASQEERLVCGFWEGAEDTSVLISELMDSTPLFLTANADTVYFLGSVDVSKGPMGVEPRPLAFVVLSPAARAGCRHTQGRAGGWPLRCWTARRRF